MNILKKKMNIYSILLFVLIAFESNFFYLIDKYNFKIINIGYYEIIMIINILIFLVYLLFKFSNFIKLKLNFYVYGGFFLALSSSCVAFFTYGQNIFYGLLAQREWLSCLLLFFPIKYLIDNEKISFTDVKNVFTICAIIIVSLIFIQYFLVDNVKFLKADYSNRYGTTRIRLDLQFLIIYLCLNFDMIFENRSKKVICHIFLVICILIIVVYISKLRMLSISVVIGIIACLFFRKEKKLRKTIYFGVIILGVCIFSFSSMGEDLINIIIGKVDDNLYYRDIERTYYLEILNSNPLKYITGNGFPSQACPYAIMIDSGVKNGVVRFYTSDLGLFGYMFRYGMIGVFWCCSIYVYCLYMSYKVFKKTNKVGYLFFIIVHIIGCYTLQSALFLPFVDFIIYYLFLEKDYQNIKGV